MFLASDSLKLTNWERKIVVWGVSLFFYFIYYTKKDHYTPLSIEPSLGSNISLRFITGYGFLPME